MPIPCVSVIVVNMNGRDLLRECLKSLVQQSFRDLEVIVVDNSSTDGSQEMLRVEFPEVRVVALHENRGYCGGNNAGIAIAQGEYIALLNNDAVVSPSWLTELVNAVQRSGADMAASRVILFNQKDLLDSAGDGLAITGNGFRRGHLHSPKEFDSPCFVFGPSGSAAFYKREVFEKVGVFDEDFFAVYEDVDLAFRAQSAGYKAIYVPTAEVWHRGGSTIGYLSENYVYWGHRNVEYLFWKNMPTLLIALCLLPHLLYEIGGFAYFARHGQAHTFWRAKQDALKSWQSLLAKRRQVQRLRRVPTREISKWIDWNFIERLKERFSE